MPAVRRILLVFAAYLLLAVESASAQPPAVILPPPRPVFMESFPTYTYDPRLAPGQNPMDIWQYYGVDRTGNFRPRVIVGPFNTYYLRNGQPYPWAENHPTWWMPYVVGN